MLLDGAFHLANTLHDAFGGKLIEQLRSRSPDALAYTKKLLHSTWSRSPRWAFCIETVLQVRLMTGAKHRIARTALLRGEVPEFAERRLS